MNAKISWGLKARQFDDPFADPFAPARSSVILTPRQAGKSTGMADLAKLQEQINAQTAASLAQMSTAIVGASTSSAPAATISATEMMAKLEDVKKTIAASAPHPGPAWKKPTMFDQITAAATQFTKFEEERWTMDSKELAAKQLATQINDTFRQAQVTGTVYSPFQLNGPAQLTIKTRQSQYKKKAFLGDEQLIFTSAYAGKRDGVIAVFKNRVPVDYAYIEIPLDEAMTQLKGFKQFVDSLQIPDLEAVLTGVESQKQHAAAVEHNRLLETAPEFASW